MGGGGAEQEHGVGRALLHDLQKHVLVPLVELAAVGEEVDLPLPLVGPDVDLLLQLPHLLHRQLTAVVIPDGDHVGVDVGKHLAADVAFEAGALFFPAEVGRRHVASGGGEVAASREDEGVAQRAAVGHGPDPAGKGAV